MVFLVCLVVEKISLKNNSCITNLSDYQQHIIFIRKIYINIIIVIMIVTIKSNLLL